jgi:hypothetical protein
MREIVKVWNKETYIDILHRPRDAVRWKSPEKRRTGSWAFLHDNAPAHQSVLVKCFISKKQSDNILPASTEISIEGTALLSCYSHQQECDGGA